MDVTRSRISPSGIGFGVGNSLGAFGLADRVEFESDRLKKKSVENIDFLTQMTHCDFCVCHSM